MKNLLLIGCFVCVQILSAQVTDFKTINFTRADNIAQLNKGAKLDNLPVLAYNLTHKLNTDAEKFRAIYSWVCNNIKGDLNQDQKVSKYRKKYKNDSLTFKAWNDQYKTIAFKRLFKRKKTMCSGYAYLINQLCFLANIESKIINGYGRSSNTNTDTLQIANHAWNAVKLNNKWYLCDATWSSGYFLNDIFINDYNLGYFLTDPKLFRQNHYPLNTQWLLDNNSNNNAFVASPIVYGATFKHQILTTSPSKLYTNVKINNAMTFSFEALKPIKKEQISLVYFSGGNLKSLKIFDLNIQGQSIAFKHLFKTEGWHDVHLKINNDIVATYTIQVMTE
ncbi:transglutaminase domain-containing protein [uncultured Olleya sp.]|uniref:transglutaminase domain-containing protein n=1 Tax=uncultured Olleya sp. TaxID=757243 RepID=UPI002596F00A|nr:transglutaminase domain-containing protein [uncultured Olleya sp.]